MMGGESRAAARGRPLDAGPRRRGGADLIDPPALASQAQYEGQMPTLDCRRIRIRHGVGDWQFVSPNQDASGVVEVAQGEDVEVRLPPAGSGGYLGYEVVGHERRPLPLGSMLDGLAGTFTWRPAAGFLGSFGLEFSSGAETVVPLRLVVGPPMRTVIETPANGTEVASSFVLSGWSVDLASVSGTGVDIVLAWAFPVDRDASGALPAGSGPDPGATPIWIGAASPGPPRSELGRIYGPAFVDAAYRFNISTLAPGTYDLAVYPRRTSTGQIEGARIVRVTVR